MINDYQLHATGKPADYESDRLSPLLIKLRIPPDRQQAESVVGGSQQRFSVQKHKSKSCKKFLHAASPLVSIEINSLYTSG